MQENYISLFEKGVIIGLKIAGLNDQRIENILAEHNLKGSRVSIGRIWNNWQTNPQSVQSFEQKSGRPQSMTEQDIQNLSNYVKSNPTSSRKDLESNCEANPLGLTGKTLQNVLINEGFKQKVQEKVIEITPLNKQKRIKWAKDLLRDKRKIIKSCVYSDETYIEFQNHRKTYIWTHQDEPEAEKQPIKSWPAKILIWGSISQNGPECIQFVEGNINQEQYSYKNVPKLIIQLILAFYPKVV
ncbi:hypothetical protein ABPG72_020111 [Tetrahymena utriculariae]